MAAGVKLLLGGQRYPPQTERMSPVANNLSNTGTEQATDFAVIEAALDIILNSQSLEQLCQRTVTDPKTHQVFQGAHVLLNSDGRLSYDSGFGQDLPLTHMEIAKSAIASQSIEFRSEAGLTPAMLAIPFLRHNYAEAVGILVLSPGANQNYLAGQLEPILTNLTGFYLETKYGLGN